MIYSLMKWGRYKWGIEILYYIVLLLSISPFGSINICFIYLDASMLSACMITFVLSSWWSNPFIIIQWYSSSIEIRFGLNVYFVWCKYSHLWFLLSIGMRYHSAFIHFQPLCVLKVRVNLLLVAYCWILFLIHSAILCLIHLHLK